VHRVHSGRQYLRSHSPNSTMVLARTSGMYLVEKL
jgi:hypothetical protein